MIPASPVASRISEEGSGTEGGGGTVREVSLRHTNPFEMALPRVSANTILEESATDVVPASTALKFNVATVNAPGGLLGSS